VLNGAKMWITNGSTADIAIIWAKTGDLDDVLLHPRLHRPHRHARLQGP
jgi:alkylation response protein AidB-like acyl-CoA dehydrogenase